MLWWPPRNCQTYYRYWDGPNPGVEGALDECVLVVSMRGMRHYAGTKRRVLSFSVAFRPLPETRKNCPNCCAFAIVRDTFNDPHESPLLHCAPIHITRKHDLQTYWYLFVRHVPYFCKTYYFDYNTAQWSVFYGKVYKPLVVMMLGQKVEGMLNSQLGRRSILYSISKTWVGRNVFEYVLKR